MTEGIDEFCSCIISTTEGLIRMLPHCSETSSIFDWSAGPPGKVFQLVRSRFNWHLASEPPLRSYRVLVHMVQSKITSLPILNRKLDLNRKNIMLE